jgi:hypothetical protein
LVWFAVLAGKENGQIIESVAAILLTSRKPLEHRLVLATELPAVRLQLAFLRWIRVWIVWRRRIEDLAL